MNRVVTFGEIMGRLAPRGFLRLRQSMPGTLEITFAGAEVNVAASIAYLGGESAFVSALPDHCIADACIANLKAMGVDTQFILQSKQGRLGLFFLETGANQRPSNVIYDREGSAFSMTPADRYPWGEIFDGVAWLHVSGITPAVSRIATQAALAAIREASERKIKVSFDLNFRRKLWNWEPGIDPRDLAERTVRQVLPYVDVVIANEEDAAQMLGIQAAHTDVDAGEIAIDQHPEVAREIVRQFPNVSQVAVTLRQSISASHNNWGAMLYDAAQDLAIFAPLKDGIYHPYPITHIVDRVGGGDAFAAGLIFASMTPPLSSPQTALAFAIAASCLAQSIQGDFNFSSRREIEALMAGFASGRVVR